MQAPRGLNAYTSTTFEFIAGLCIPVLVSDDVELPFEDFLDYQKFSLKVSAVPLLMLDPFPLFWICVCVCVCS